MVTGKFYRAVKLDLASMDRIARKSLLDLRSEMKLKKNCQSSY